MKHFEITVVDTVGSLAEATRELNYQGVNLLGIFCGILDGKGHIALVTGDPVKSARVMTEANLDFCEEEVTVVRIEHISGALHKVAGTLAEAGINIRYIYPLMQNPPGVPLVFKTDDPAKADEVLRKARMQIVESV